MIEEGFLIHIRRLEVVTVLENFHSLFFFFAQCLGDVDTDIDNDIAYASAITLDSRKAFASESDLFARLSSRVYFQSYFSAADGRDFYISPQDSRRQIQKQVVIEVLAVTYECVVLFFLDDDLDAPAHAIVAACISLAWYIEDHTVSNTCRDMDIYNFLAVDNPFAVTFLAFVFDDDTVTMTSRAGSLCLHHAENRTDGFYRIPCAMTCRASLGLCPSFAACAMTVRAVDIFPDLEFLGHAIRDFLQREVNGQSEVGTFGLRRLTCPVATEAPAETSETMTSEDVSEHGEDVIHIHPSTAESSEVTLRTVESELIILAALVRVV